MSINQIGTSRIGCAVRVRTSRGRFISRMAEIALVSETETETETKIEVCTSYAPPRVRVSAKVWLVCWLTLLAVVNLTRLTASYSLTVLSASHASMVHFLTHHADAVFSGYSRLYTSAKLAEL